MCDLLKNLVQESQKWTMLYRREQIVIYKPCHDLMEGDQQ
jgi:hypothetical protein